VRGRVERSFSDQPCGRRVATAAAARPLRFAQSPPITQRRVMRAPPAVTAPPRVAPRSAWRWSPAAPCPNRKSAHRICRGCPGASGCTRSQRPPGHRGTAWWVTRGWVGGWTEVVGGIRQQIAEQPAVTGQQGTPTPSTTPPPPTPATHGHTHRPPNTTPPTSAAAWSRCRGSL